MQRRLLPAGDGQTSADPKDSPDGQLGGRIQAAEQKVTPRAHPRSPRWLYPRGVGLPESGPNSKIDQLEYELSMNLKALKYPPAIYSWGDSSFQE